jgi:hypothetical protein
MAYCRLRLGRMVLAILLIGFWPTAALACRCIEPTQSQAYKQAQAIALGTIVSVSKESEYNVFYTVSVDESWKEKVGDYLVIRSGSTCIYHADVGQKYLLFLWPYTSDMYQTSICMGNQPEATANRALKFLRSMRRSQRPN